MAKPTTYSKRDNEKKKQEKRVEKQKKKESRKLNDKPAGFDDMIAYVDENGRISSTPPSERNNDMPAKSNRDQDHSHENTAMEQRKSGNNMTELKGRVEHVNAEKGYGFIKETSQTDKYFFHVSGLLDAIQVGDAVLFDLERGKKGYNAVRIRKQAAD
jgi:cold shock CspA family protein